VVGWLARWRRQPPLTRLAAKEDEVAIIALCMSRSGGPGFELLAETQAVVGGGANDRHSGSQQQVMSKHKKRQGQRDTLQSKRQPERQMWRERAQQAAPHNYLRQAIWCQAPLACPLATAFLSFQVCSYR